MDIPFRLNFEQQKKRAKELLKAFKEGQPESADRFHKHPKVQFTEISIAEFQPKLADAQLVIAKELNCKSWAQLKRHCELMQQMQIEIGEQQSIPNEGQGWLHIRCGSDIQQTLPKAGFVGQFLEFSDPLTLGPISYNYSLEQRSGFLHHAFGRELNLTVHQTKIMVETQFEGLTAAINNKHKIALWFEHDTYDQFILIFILSLVFKSQRKPHLELISINQFPGSIKFTGLGQLPPEALRWLWQTKTPVTKNQLASADQYWRAFTDAEGSVFQNLVETLDECPLPFFKTAAQRQIQEMPKDDDQLSLTHQLVLEILSDGIKTAGKVFGILMREKEPLPWLGDLMFWYLLQQLLSSHSPLVEIIEDHEDWPQKQIALTNEGRRFINR